MFAERILKSSLMNYKGYKDLECYIKARELRIFISVLAKKNPANEKFLLTAQIVDCSRSVTRNIAEGYGRLLLQIPVIFLLLPGVLLQKQWNN